jgi:hypothetical protein
MHRSYLLVLGLLLVSAPVFGQSNSTDSQTQQALLEEVRQLRHDLQTATVSAQRAQILIHRVEAQESVVRLTQERVDTARSDLRSRDSGDVHSRAPRHARGPNGGAALRMKGAVI